MSTPDDTITVYFRSQAELEKKLVAILSAFGYEIFHKDRWESYDQVRKRYPHLSAPAFTNRVARFQNNFPRIVSANGRRTVKLVVTAALHRALDAPLYDRRSQKQARANVGSQRGPGKDSQKDSSSPAKPAKILEKRKGRRRSEAKDRLAKGSASQSQGKQ